MDTAILIQEVVETDDLVVSGCCSPYIVAARDDVELAYGHCHEDLAGNVIKDWEEVL